MEDLGNVNNNLPMNLSLEEIVATMILEELHRLENKLRNKKLWTMIWNQVMMFFMFL
jgi:hypothetical protein